MDLTNLTIDDLELDLTVPPARGRRPAAISVTYVRDITPADILVLQEGRIRNIQPPAIQTLKNSHHQLARLLAEGTKHAEASLITGYSQSRISILLQDPAFTELVEHYAGVTREIYVNIHERLASFSLDALETLARRHEEDPDKFSNKELMEMIGLGFDRSGYGPKSTQVHEHNISADELLSSIKEEIQRKQNGSIKTLDARPRPSDSTGSSTSREANGAAGEHSNIEASGSQEGRESLREAGGNLLALPAGQERGEAG